MDSIRRLLLTGTVATLLIGVASGQSPQAAPETATLSREVAAPPPATLPITPEVEALRRDLRQLVQGPSARNWTSSVLVVSLDRGDTLFSHNPDLPLAPASNMKLFSTAAALYYLGPSFRYSTFALADGEIRNGTLDGDLVLYGTGDPSISSRMLTGALPPLRALADSLVAMGVSEVHGDVIGDGSYFDDQWIGDGWREEYRLASYSAPIGALSLAENIVSVRIEPGVAAGQPARITTLPATDGLLVDNRVRTVASGATSVRFSYDPAGLVVEGQIARGNRGIARTVTVVDPANFAAAAFRRVLEQAGVTVHGGVRTVRRAEESAVWRANLLPAGAETRPPPRVIGVHLSPPLTEMSTVTNHVSQNLFAEALFKTVGRVAIGQGSFGAGASALQYFLECENPFDSAGIRFVDGSGLSPLNRVTARATIHLLDLMTRTDVWEEFHASLPEAATSSGGLHSLRNRMGGSRAAGNLRAKTGTISNVSSLSGYVRADNGELLAFSIYANEVSVTGLAKRVEDAIGARLAIFTRPASAEAILAGSGGEAAPYAASAGRITTLDEGAIPAESTGEVGSATVVVAAARTHTIRSGETLDAIARRYGTTAAEIQRLNPRLEPRRLRPGQSITLPAG